ncbi:MAG: alpha/beta hydrolase [archaeon]|nr:MAG: alpha/beta hydrolase [archaeon]
MKTEKVRFKSGGHKLVGEINFPEKINGKLPAIILFHGLSNSRRDCPLINETSKALTENGFIAFRFDFYGSGESPGEMRDKIIDILEQNTKDAIEFITKYSQVDSNKLGLWGRSLGGTFVCLLPTDPRIKARVVASSGPIIEKIMEEKLEELKKKELELEKVGKRLPGTGAYKGPFEFRPAWFESLKGLDSRVLENLKNLNTVLVLGTSLDQKVTVDSTCMVMNNVKEPKRIWVFNTDHDYGGFEKHAVEETLNWFKKFL